MGELIVTVGTGHNGSRSVHHLLESAGIYSRHEMWNRLCLVEIAHYSKDLWLSEVVETGDYWNHWVAHVEKLIGIEGKVHLSDSSHTLLVRKIVDEFGGRHLVKFIALQRKGVYRLIELLVGRDLYLDRPYGLIPRDRVKAREFSQSPLPVKAAWYVRTKERALDENFMGAPVFQLATEDISTRWRPLVDFCGGLTDRVDTSLLTKRFGHKAVDPDIRDWVEDCHYKIGAVLGGLWDEPLE